MMTMIHRAPGLELMGTSEIENLQRALANLATATQQPAISAKVTGIVDDQTMTAVAAALGLLSKELPSWAYLGLQGIMALGVTNATAKKTVGEYATQLTLAANTAAVKFKVAPTAPTAPIVVASPGFFGPGWYKTPIGLLLIAGLLLAGYKLFLAKPAAKAA